MALTLLAYAEQDVLVPWIKVIHPFTPCVKKTGYKEFSVDIYVGF